MSPKGILLDYGETRVEEVRVDLRAGNAWLLSQAVDRPADLTLERVMERTSRVASQIAERRDRFGIETSWPALTRLTHDYVGTRFDLPMPELEMGFWKASVETRAMPGAEQALERLHQANLPIAVVSNTSFGEPIIRYELDRHGLARHLAFIVVSSEYAVRKPSPFLFDTAAARLNVPAHEIWFMGDRLDTDVEGAKAAGMTAVWFNPQQHFDPARAADVSVTNWEDFARRALDTDL